MAPARNLETSHLQQGMLPQPRRPGLERPEYAPPAPVAVDHPNARDEQIERRNEMTERRQRTAERSGRDTTDEILERATKRGGAEIPDDSYERAAQDPENHPDPEDERELEDELHDDLLTVAGIDGGVVGTPVLRAVDIAEPEVGPDGEPKLE